MLQKCTERIIVPHFYVELNVWSHILVLIIIKKELNFSYVCMGVYVYNNKKTFVKCNIKRNCIATCRINSYDFKYSLYKIIRYSLYILYKRSLKKNIRESFFKIGNFALSLLIRIHLLPLNYILCLLGIKCERAHHEFFFINSKLFQWKHRKLSLPGKAIQLIQNFMKLTYPKKESFLYLHKKYYVSRKISEAVSHIVWFIERDRT